MTSESLGDWYLNFSYNNNNAKLNRTLKIFSIKKGSKMTKKYGWKKFLFYGRHFMIFGKEPV